MIGVFRKRKVRRTITRGKKRSLKIELQSDARASTAVVEIGMQNEEFLRSAFFVYGG